MKKEELKAALEAPRLDPRDAPGYEHLVDHINDQQKVIRYMFEMLGAHAGSIIALRKEMVEVKGDLMLHEVPREEEQSSIIMPPKLELN